MARAGFRFGARGTHTSRTMMLTELTETLAHVSLGSPRDAFAEAIVENNILGKSTASTRGLTYQRLGELYGLDPSVPLFRVLDRLWRIEPAARPHLALLAALARDPLLRATAEVILSLAPGEELSRTKMVDAIRGATDNRLNAAVCDKVARNVASTWAQSGHLTGRVRKIRQLVTPSPTAAAFALWLAWIEGGSGEKLLRSMWARLLDRSPSELLQLSLAAKQMGLIRLRTAGGVIEIDPLPLDPVQAMAR